MNILYKKNVDGSLQQWSVETSGDKLRTTSGRVNGKQTTSKWYTCNPKNVGKSNATTGEEQAILEAASRRQKKIDKGYFPTKEEALGTEIFKPMLARIYNPNKFEMAWPVFTQPKIDGIRLNITKDKIVAARSGKPIVTVPNIWEYTRKLFKTMPTLVLDGELYSEEFKNDFEKLISIARKSKPTKKDLELSRDKLRFYIYDIYDSSMPNAIFKIRTNRIRTLSTIYKFEEGQPVTMLVTDTANSLEEIENLHKKYTGWGQEGTMIRANAIYEQKRSKNLLKYKDFIDEEFEIIDINEGKGGWQGMAKSMSFATKKGAPFDAGIRGTQEYCKELLDNKNKYIGKSATVMYQNLTAQGVPRFPIVHVIHPTLKRDY